MKLWSLSLVLLAVVAWAEKLPLRTYTASDGLAHNAVNRIVRDSRGYLWFCTSEGLSRFDGYEFHSYRQRDGLPHRDVRDFLETKNGEFWIATSGGLCRYYPKHAGRDRFHAYPIKDDDRASAVNVLLEDRQGRIWCGTDDGLFRAERTRGSGEIAIRRIDLGIPPARWAHRVISSLLEDSRGDIWIGSASGLFRFRGEGQIARFAEDSGLPRGAVTALFSDRQDRIWVGTDDGLFRLAAHPEAGHRVVDAVVRTKDGLGSSAIRSLLQLRDGTICAGTNAGFSAASSAQSFVSYAAAQGLPKSPVTALAEDAAGNLWIGTDGGGVVRLAWKTMLTYTAEDGLAGTKIESIIEGADGHLCVVTRNGTTDLYVNEFGGRAFHAIRVNLPPGTQLLNWGPRSQSVLRDRAGDWWIATAAGILRFSGVRQVADLGSLSPVGYSERDGLPAGAVVALFEDAAGTIWASTTGTSNSLVRWDRTARAFRPHTAASQAPWLVTAGVALFAGDASGGLWTGLLRFGRNQPELARLRGELLQRIGGGTEAPAGGVRAMRVDARNRLWVGTNQSGVMRFDAPGADQPSFLRYSTANGLSSDVVLALAEDRDGNIYIGHGSGVDRLDPATGKVRQYTSADGLAAGEVYAAYCDRQGALWFGTVGGVSRLDPSPEQSHAPPRVVITSLRLAGVLHPASELGETEIAGVRTKPGENDVDVSFSGLAFAPAETLRYQYRLEGADEDWSTPSLQRSVNYANLAPASYRFLVRVVDTEGVASERAASVSFVIPPPFWLRWWFLLLATAAVAGAVYSLHRYRMTRLLELEQVRTRIATDLHDDIGSSLSQIAILSEIATRRVERSETRLAEPLADIAGIAREVVDSMSDIVWATDPERDYLKDLVYRMRRFASDSLSPREIRFRFQCSGEQRDLHLSADVRRQIFLVFKEGVNNLVRHSVASEAHIDFRAEHGWLNLKIADNGKGFDAGAIHDGHGLRSMRERARRVNGILDVQSGAAGTTVDLRVPLAPGKVQPARTPHK